MLVWIFLIASISFYTALSMNCNSSLIVIDTANITSVSILSLVNETYSINISNHNVSYVIQPDNEINITGLCPNFNYTFNFTSSIDFCTLDYSIDRNNISLSSSVVMNITVNTSINASAPVGVNTNRFITTLFWNPPVLIYCPIQEYEITLNQLESDRRTAVYTFYMFHDLIPNTAYNVSITPITLSGNGQNFTKSFQTPEDIPWSPPMNFSIEGNGKSSVRISWKPPNMPNTELSSIWYNITIERENGMVHQPLIFNYPIVTGTINNLNLYERVCAHMTAFNSIGKGPTSNVSCSHTLESSSGPVSSLAYTIIDEDSIGLIWQSPASPNGVITGYRVRVFPTNSDSLLQMHSTTCNVTFMHISNLDLNKNYRVFVNAINNAGNGEDSFIYTYSGNLSVDLLSSITAERTSNTSFELNWSKADDFVGVITRYELEYFPIGVMLYYTESEARLIIKSNETSINVQGLDMFASYMAVMTAVSSHEIQTIKLVIPGFNYSKTNVELDTLRLRFFGNINCSINNETFNDLLLISIEHHLVKYCGCELKLLPEHNISCDANNDNTIIAKVKITEEFRGYASAWLSSPNPLIVVEDKILLVKTSQLTCFYGDIDNCTLHTTLDAEQSSSMSCSCTTVAVGVAFGLFIFGAALASLIWMVIMYFCISSNSYTVKNENSRIWRKVHRRSDPKKSKSSPAYENVNPITTSTSHLKLNVLNTTPTIVIEQEDDYANQNEFLRATNPNDSANPVSGKKALLPPTTTKTPTSSSEGLQKVESTKEIETKPTTTEGFNRYVKTPSKSDIKGGVQTVGQTNMRKPQVKPKPKDGQIGNVSIQSNVAYNKSKRSENDSRILALQNFTK